MDKTVESDYRKLESRDELLMIIDKIVKLKNTGTMEYKITRDLFEEDDKILLGQVHIEIKGSDERTEVVD